MFRVHLLCLLRVVTSETHKWRQMCKKKSLYALLELLMSVKKLKIVFILRPIWGGFVRPKHQLVSGFDYIFVLPSSTSVKALKFSFSIFMFFFFFPWHWAFCQTLWLFSCKKIPLMTKIDWSIWNIQRAPQLNKRPLTRSQSCDLSIKLLFWQDAPVDLHVACRCQSS